MPQNKPFEHKLCAKDTEIISNEVNKLLDKGVISITEAFDSDFFSSLFVRPKKDGSYRTILNLKNLNKECDTYHFKIESIKQVIHMITPGCFLASLDIRDAFYSIPIYIEHNKFLKFMWLGVAYQFEVMPNGYVDAMRIFTKILKPVFAHLRELGHTSVIYVDDSLLGGDTFVECKENVMITRSLLEELGFYIQYEKSVIVPTQEITFLGFNINTVDMTISLTEKKKENIIRICNNILNGENNTIRQVASLLGNMSASFEAVPYGRLYYRNLEADKIYWLKIHKGKFDEICHISKEGKQNIMWWRDNITSAIRSLHPTPAIDYTIFTDASRAGWGANDQNITINGRWNNQEQQYHINVLEILAIYYALLSFLYAGNKANHIRIMSDHATAISYINNKGGCKSLRCNKISFDIWQLCIKYKTHLSAAHIPGSHNIVADVASRQFKDSAEWMLNPHIFKKLTEILGNPNIDLFATRLNKQLSTYASWMPDPGSKHIDAMAISWVNYFPYIFPPFSMIWPVLRKMMQQSNRAIIVVPLWPTQTWFPVLLKMAIQDPLIINSTELRLPGTSKTHPLSPKMKLMGILCSKSTEKQQDYQQTLPKYYQQHGERILQTNTPGSSKDTRTFVVKKRLITCRWIQSCNF